jgi:hypothetical protein
VNVALPLIEAVLLFMLVAALVAIANVIAR